MILLEQYDNCELKPPNGKQSGANKDTEKYEVTLLLNCLLGLIVLPNERHKESLVKEGKKIRIDDMRGWGVDENTVMKWSKIPSHSRTLYDVVRRMRNSVAHFGIKVCASDTGRRDIYAIEFRDVNPRDKNDTFYMKIEVDELKMFVKRLAEFLIAK